MISAKRGLGKESRNMAKRISMILAIVSVAAATFGAACGDGDGGGAEAAEVEAAVRAAIDAWNGKDAEAFLAGLTDQGLEVFFDATRQEAEQFLPQFIGEPPITLGEFSDTQVDGENASTAAGFFLGGVGAPTRFSLVREAEAWLIDGREFIAGDVPEGTTAVDLAMSEFAFDFDENEITGGNIAFNVENSGAEPHQVVIARVSEDLDLEQAVRSEEEEPPGVEELGFVGDFEPGTESTVLLAEELQAGRYAIVCFVEAADGETHAVKGMFADFTVG
jgi:hypothetical protein